MNQTKYFALLLAACSAWAVAEPGFYQLVGGENPAYINMKNLKPHPENPNLLVYQKVLNVHDAEAGTFAKSLVDTHYLDCRNKIDISRPEPSRAYSDFFGRGELLHEIPMESERRELNGLSLSSLGAAAVCKVAGQDFGGNPNAYDELKKELARIQKELMQNR